MVVGMWSLREEVLCGAIIEALLIASLPFVASGPLGLIPSTHRAETMLEGLASTITVTGVETAAITVEKTSISRSSSWRGWRYMLSDADGRCVVICST